MFERMLSLNTEAIANGGVAWEQWGDVKVIVFAMKNGSSRFMVNYPAREYLYQSDNMIEASQCVEHMILEQLKG